ncbi:MAG: RDD family protein [Actinomycetota bacterium]|nr:RDD family protein [Actinomycetota bacterium]
MTATRPQRPPTPLETAKQHVEQAFGPKIAKRLETCKDGTFYVRAGAWAGLLAWLVDFVVYLLGVVVVVVAMAAAVPDLSDNAITLILLGLLVGVPLVYGLFYGNGRWLGAVVTGTRLVRLKNGQRIGTSACWAMLVRNLLFPLLLVALFMALLGGGGSAPGDLTRISIDDEATQRLHAAGFLRLPEPGRWT